MPLHWTGTLRVCSLCEETVIRWQMAFKFIEGEPVVCDKCLYNTLATFKGKPTRGWIPEVAPSLVKDIDVQAKRDAYQGGAFAKWCKDTFIGWA